MRTIVGVHALQSAKSRFNQSIVEETCPHCRLGPEDLSHTFLHCPALTDIREVQRIEIGDFVTREHGCRVWSSWSKCEFIAVLVDNHHLGILLLLRVDSDVLLQMEALSRRYCYRLHVKKMQLHRKFFSLSNFSFSDFCSS